MIHHAILSPSPIHNCGAGLSFDIIQQPFQTGTWNVSFKILFWIPYSEIWKNKIIS